MAIAAVLTGTAKVSAILGNSASQTRVVAAAMNAARLNSQIDRFTRDGSGQTG